MADLLQSLIIPQQRHSDPPEDDSPSSSSLLPPPSTAPASLSSGNTASSELKRKTSEDAMSINAFTPLPGLGASQLNPSEDPAAQSTVMSIEEFEKNYPQPVKEEKKASNPPSKNKQSPQLVPKALGTRTSTQSIAFFEKCQGLGIPYPEIEYTGDTVTGWSVRCSFLDQTVEERGPFASKREAKEKVSGLSLEILNALEAEGKVSKPGKHKRLKTETDEATPENREPEINWTGLLLEYQRSVDLDQPTYDEYQLGNAFFCELTIPQRPDQPFGSQEKLFLGKKIARQNSAKEAVEWLREQGLLTETGSSIKKKKASNPALPDTPKKLSKEPSNTTGSPVTSGTTYASRVASLAATLGLNTPEWRYEEPDPRAPGFCSLACYFKNGGQHEGPIGEVRHVFGKKAAKEECARLTLGYLEQLKQEREEWGRKMLDGEAI